MDNKRPSGRDLYARSTHRINGITSILFAAMGSIFVFNCVMISITQWEPRGIALALATLVAGRIIYPLAVRMRKLVETPEGIAVKQRTGWELTPWTQIDRVERTNTIEMGPVRPYTLWTRCGEKIHFYARRKHVQLIAELVDTHVKQAEQARPPEASNTPR